MSKTDEFAHSFRAYDKRRHLNNKRSRVAINSDDMPPGSAKPTDSRITVCQLPLLGAQIDFYDSDHNKLSGRITQYLTRPKKSSQNTLILGTKVNILNVGIRVRLFHGEEFDFCWPHECIPSSYKMKNESFTNIASSSQNKNTDILELEPLETLDRNAISFATDRFDITSINNINQTSASKLINNDSLVKKATTENALNKLLFEDSESESDLEASKDEVKEESNVKNNNVEDRANNLITMPWESFQDDNNEMEIDGVLDSLIPSNADYEKGLYI